MLEKLIICDLQSFVILEDTVMGGLRIFLRIFVVFWGYFRVFCDCDNHDHYHSDSIDL
jgi:hypothetical protein